MRRCGEMGLGMVLAANIISAEHNLAHAEKTQKIGQTSSLADTPEIKKDAEVELAFGAGTTFSGNLRRGRGLYFQVNPLFVDLTLKFGKFALGAGAHGGWGGGRNGSLDLHLAAGIEGEVSKNHSLGIGIGPAFGFEHDEKGWINNAGGILDTHYNYKHLVLMLGLAIKTNLPIENSKPVIGWETTSGVGYNFN